MRNDIQLFNNTQFGQIRVAQSENGEPLFCLADVCNALELSNASQVKSRLNQEGVYLIDLQETNMGVIQNEGVNINELGNTKVNFIDEGNLYKCVIRSYKPQAEPFQDWICYDVIPSIRKHGAYLTPQKIEEALLNPDTLIQLATNLKSERQKRIAAERQLQAIKPKADFLDKVLDCGEKIDIGQAAKILKLPFGRNTMFAKLRQMGVFFRQRNEPKQEYIDRKYFEVYEQLIPRNSHDGFIVLKVLVTQKGLAFLDKIFKAEQSDRIMAKI